MRKGISFVVFLSMGICMYADVEKVVPNFLIKADVAGAISINEKPVTTDVLGKLTFALDPFFILDNEEVSQTDFRITPQLKMDISYDIQNEAKIGLHGHLLIFEAGAFYNITSNKFTFDYKFKPEWDYYFSDLLGLNVAPFLGTEVYSSSVFKINLGLELGLVLNPTRKHRNNIIKDNLEFKRHQKELEQQEQQQEKERRQESLKLARRIICKKYGFDSEREYIDWLNRTDYKNLINSLSSGDAYRKPFVVGDIIYMKPHIFSIGTWDYYDGDSFVYLVSLQGLGHYCEIISSHQIEYLSYTGGLITEPLLLEFVGRGTYRRGYSIKECDTFVVVEKGSYKYNTYINKMHDISAIENNPYLYKDILGEEYDAE